MKKLFCWSLLSLYLVTSLNIAQADDKKISLADLSNRNTLQSGFIDIIQDDDAGKTYLRINNLHSEFIYQTSLPSGLGSNDIGLDRGQLGNTHLVEFERAGNKVFLKQKPTDFRAITDNLTEAAAIDEAFASSILWGFEIVDSGKEGGKDWVLVDASDFVLQDIHGVGRRLEAQKQGSGYAVDKTRSALDAGRSKAFPDNTELESTITLVGSKPGNHVQDTVPNPFAITLKMHHSFVRLPDDGYTARRYHPKSGYWAIQYRDYAQPINADITQQFIGRHRLEKKDPDAERSEAVEPIIYYLDPGVPEPVRSALIDGAMWWNSAFEAIGFVDAFQVKTLPANADPMDVRYNVIQWVHRSTRGWSYGSTVVDPRNGEIIKGHVTLGSLRVRQDYLIAQAMLAPFADSEDDQALMDLALARIRQLSAHEVGHTIGINHNFAASNYGRESVMDYPHPQFELDGDQISAANAYGVGLGKWDMAAVAYGYSQFAAEDESAALNAIIQKSDEQGLLYITDADARSAGSPHADAALWDNGADPVSELQEMMKIRKLALQKFGAANLKAGRNWADLEEILVPVYYFHRYQIEAAVKWISGLRYDYAVKQSNAQLPEKKVVSADDQLRALDAMLSTLTPDFLKLDPSLAAILLPKPAENYRSRESLKGNTGVTLDQVNMAAASAQHTLSLLLHPQRLARLEQQHALDSSIPSIADIGDALHNAVVAIELTDLDAQIHQAVVDIYYSNLLNLMHNEKAAPTVKMQIQAELHQAQDYMSRAASRARASSPYYGFYHFQSKRLEQFEQGTLNSEKINLPMMPPGSPI